MSTALKPSRATSPENHDSQLATSQRRPSAAALGARIAASRKAAGVPQDELAWLIGAHTNTVSKWERGVTVPHVLAVVDTANALNMPAAALLREDPSQPADQVRTVPPLDAALLKQAIIAVEQVIAARGLHPKASGRAEVVSGVYAQELADRRRVPDELGAFDTAARMLRLLMRCAHTE